MMAQRDGDDIVSITAKDYEFYQQMEGRVKSLTEQQKALKTELENMRREQERAKAITRENMRLKDEMEVLLLQIKTHSATSPRRGTGEGLSGDEYKKLVAEQIEAAKASMKIKADAEKLRQQLRESKNLVAQQQEAMEALLAEKERRGRELDSQMARNESELARRSPPADGELAEQIRDLEQEKRELLLRLTQDRAAISSLESDLYEQKGKLLSQERDFELERQSLINKTQLLERQLRDATSGTQNEALARARSEIASLQRQLEGAEAEIRRLNSQLLAARTGAAKEDDDLGMSDLKRQLERAQNDSRKLEESLKRARGRDSGDEVNALSDRLVTSQREVAELEHAIDRLADQAQSLRRDQTDFLLETRELRSKFAASREEVRALKARQDRMVTEANALRREWAESDATVRRLQMQLARSQEASPLEDQLSVAHSQRRALEMRTQEADKQVAAMDKIVNKYESEMNNLRDQLRQSEAELEESRRTFAREADILRESQARAVDDARRMRDDQQRAMSEADALKKKMGAFVTEARALKAQQDDEIDSLNRKTKILVRRLETETKELHDRADQEARKARDISEQLSAANRELQVTEDRLDQEQQARRSAERELKRLHGETESRRRVLEELRDQHEQSLALLKRGGDAGSASSIQRDNDKLARKYEKLKRDLDSVADRSKGRAQTADEQEQERTLQLELQNAELQQQLLSLRADYERNVRKFENQVSDSTRRLQDMLNSDAPAGGRQAQYEREMDQLRKEKDQAERAIADEKAKREYFKDRISDLEKIVVAQAAGSDKLAAEASVMRSQTLSQRRQESELNEENRRLRAEMQNVTSQARRQRDQLHDHINKLNRENEVLRKDFESLGGRDAQDNRTRQLHAENADLSSRLKALEGTIEMRSQFLEMQVNDLTSENDRIRDNITTRSARHGVNPDASPAELREENGRLRDAIESLQRAMDVEKRVLEAQLRDSRDENRVLQRRLEAAKASSDLQNDLLQIRLTELEDVNETLRRRLRNTKEGSAQQQNAVQKQIEELTRVKETLERRLESVERAAAAKESTLQERINDQAQELAAAEEERAKQRRTMDARLKEVMSQNKALRQQLAEAPGEVLESKRQQLKDTEELMQQNKSLRKKLSEQGEVVAENKRLRQKLDEIPEIMSENKKLKQQLDEIPEVIAQNKSLRQQLGELPRSERSRDTRGPAETSRRGSQASDDASGVRRRPDARELAALSTEKEALQKALEELQERYATLVVKYDNSKAQIRDAKAGMSRGGSAVSEEVVTSDDAKVQRLLRKINKAVDDRRLLQRRLGDATVQLQNTVKGAEAEKDADDVAKLVKETHHQNHEDKALYQAIGTALKEEGDEKRRATDALEGMKTSAEEKQRQVQELQRSLEQAERKVTHQAERAAALQKENEKIRQSTRGKSAGTGGASAEELAQARAQIEEEWQARLQLEAELGTVYDEIRSANEHNQTLFDQQEKQINELRQQLEESANVRTQAVEERDKHVADGEKQKADRSRMDSRLRHMQNQLDDARRDANKYQLLAESEHEQREAIQTEMARLQREVENKIGQLSNLLSQGTGDEGLARRELRALQEEHQRVLAEKKRLEDQVRASDRMLRQSEQYLTGEGPGINQQFASLQRERDKLARMLEQESDLRSQLSMHTEGLPPALRNQVNTLARERAELIEQCQRSLELLSRTKTAFGHSEQVITSLRDANSQLEQEKRELNLIIDQLYQARHYTQRG